MNLSAVILAGGQSTRMGRDKAWLEVEGESLLARQLRLVRALNPTEVLVSGRPGVDYSGLNCPVLLDLHAGRGPLGGIERALAIAKSPLLLVLAVDLPGMTTEFLKKLWAHCDEATGIVPEVNGRLEPLAAIYPKRCHAIVADLLARAQHAARDFARACQAQEAIRAFHVPQTDAVHFANWNSPSDVRG